MKFLTRFILSQIFLILLCFPANAQKFNIFASPLPPYSINKGLHLNGIAVDTLAIIMPLSGVNMTTRDVKLMLWKYALKITKKGPRTIMLNVPRTVEFDPLFKWVGPVLVEKYVVIGHKKGDKAFSLSDLDGSKVGTIRGSAPEKALIDAGVQISALKPAATPVIPIIQLKSQQLDFLVHSDSVTTYQMEKMGMKTQDYKVQYTLQKVELYFAFSKDVSDSFIKKLNENLKIMKTPGPEGKSRFDKIVAKYLPDGVMN